MKMKRFLTLVFAQSVWLTSLFPQNNCGQIFTADFDDNTLPSAITESGATGHLAVASQQLNLDFAPDPKAAFLIDFDNLSGKIFVNFDFATERNWLNAYMYFLNSNNDTIAMLLLGNAGTKSFCLSNEVFTSGNTENFIDIKTDNDAFNKNIFYTVYLEIDTDADVISANINGNINPAAQQISLLKVTENLSSISIYLDFIFGTDSETDDIIFDNFAIINSQIDRNQLQLVIDNATSTLANAVSGSEPGNFPQSAIDVLTDSLVNAQVWMDSCKATQNDIDLATSNLQTALDNFNAQIINARVQIAIDTKSGHSLNDGLGGYNMRIADCPWNYNNPVFREALSKANIGFLRYFSGTTGDYFDMNTGMFEPQWFEQTESTTSSAGWDGVPALLKWQEGKGPSRLFDLYDLLGENQAKLVITWNGFVDSPENARNLAKFCKDNNIMVECWQFCNEPNFYTVDKRHFFNNGGDYAWKMKEIAEAIKSVDPDANLALSYGWDGWGGFSNSIKSYQDSEGLYWNKTSVHSYAIHATGNDVESAVKIANARVIERTNNSYFQGIVANSWEDAQLLVTEFGVWNDYLKDNAYSMLYVTEYIARMSIHPQAWHIGKHHINNIAQPQTNHKDIIWDAWENSYLINADTLPNNYSVSTEAAGLIAAYAAINNSSYVYSTTTTGGEQVAASTGTVPAIFASSYKGDTDKDYLLIINKSEYYHDMELTLDNTEFTNNVNIYSISAQSGEDKLLIFDTTATTGDLVTVKPFSVTLVEWAKEITNAPAAPRIYQVQHGNQQVTLKWWKRDGATSYTVKYGTSSGNFTEDVTVDSNSTIISGLSTDQSYYFVVTASNAIGESNTSNQVETKIAAPAKPTINFITADDGRITLHWESVPYANGYKVKYGTSTGNYASTVDAKNVSGYVIRWIENDVPLFITISAYNGSGESANADEVVATPKADIPWAPVLLNGTEETSGAITLNWTASIFNHNATFNLYYCESPWDTATYTLVSSEISTTTFTDITPRKDGKHFYRVSAKNASGESYFLSNIATVWKTQDNTTGINEQKLMESALVFPNPSSGEVVIHYPDNSKTCSACIYSLQGKEMFRTTFVGKTLLHLNNLSKGIYIIELSDQHSTATQKLVLH